MMRFADGGSEALVIEQLAAALGCSKSSFYWHFSNRDTFLQRVVERWRERATMEVIHFVSSQAGAKEQILGLLRRMFSATQKGDFLFYLRKLSLAEPAYRRILDEVEHLRIKYAKELFERKGMSAERASRLSSMLYHYYLGWYERHKYEHVSERQVELHVQMLWDEWFDNEGGRR